jgi:hypothetical protein
MFGNGGNFLRRFCSEKDFSSVNRIRYQSPWEWFSLEMLMIWND